MLLQRLVEYAAREDTAVPSLYVAAPVRYVIDLDRYGHPRSRQPIDTADPSSPQTRRGQRVPVPQVQRSSGVKPLLLADNAEYTLGLSRPDSKPDRVAACHAAYKALVDRCAEVTGEPAVAAVRTFLESDPGSQLDLDDSFDRGAIITIRVDGERVVDLPAVQRFWADYNAPGAASEKPAAIMQCIVCGEERPVLDRLQGKIKGVPGGQTAGTALISANSDAFESYGLSASLIAPTCSSCGERFTKALNGLLADRSHRYVLGGSAFVFWTREKVAFDLTTFLSAPDSEAVRALLDSLRSPHGSVEIDETAFYATVLSGSGGRTVVREWLDTTVGQVRRQLGKWFERQRIVGPTGDESRPLSLYALAAATVRDPAKDLAPPTPRALLRGALTDTPLPRDLLYQAVRRNRAEQRVTRERAALIKLVLSSHDMNAPEDAMIQLDPANPNPAYRCGRLLAVVEQAQVLAIPNINATVVDRFFGTASSAPVSVFPRLLRGAQVHLAKLRRDNPGAYSRIQEQLEEVQAGLTGFPRTLSLEDQGRFSLGYYHQRALNREQARLGAERKRAAAASGAATPSDDDERSATEYAEEN